MNLSLFLKLLFGSIGVIGVLIAARAFYLNFLSKPKVEIDALIIQYRATQRMNLTLQESLKKYIKTYDAGEQIFSNYIDVSCNSYLQTLKNSYDEYLSEQLLKKILNEKLTKPLINKMMNSLEMQFNDLQNTNDIIRMKLK